MFIHFHICILLERFASCISNGQLFNWWWEKQQLQQQHHRYDSSRCNRYRKASVDIGRCCYCCGCCCVKIAICVADRLGQKCEPNRTFLLFASFGIVSICVSNSMCVCVCVFLLPLRTARVHTRHKRSPSAMGDIYNSIHCVLWSQALYTAQTDTHTRNNNKRQEMFIHTIFINKRMENVNIRMGMVCRWMSLHLRSYAVSIHFYLIY